MARTKIRADESLDATVLRSFGNSCKAFVHARFDDFLDECLLRDEVAVEAAMGQPGVSHQRRHTDAVQALFAEACRGDLHNTAMRMRRILVTAGLVAVAGGGLWLREWWWVGRFFEETDDAFVGADITTIASKVPGFVVKSCRDG
jgi:Arc/MetJ family transcription regulator